MLDTGVYSSVKLCPKGSTKTDMTGRKEELIMTWGIKEFSEKTGASVDTLRYYEKEGVLSPTRTESGYRRYSEDDLAIMKNVLVMKYAHFTLAEMRNMEEALTREPSAECKNVTKTFVAKKITQLELAISNYTKIVSLMKTLLPMLDDTNTFNCRREEIDAFMNDIFEEIKGEK